MSRSRRRRGRVSWTPAHCEHGPLSRENPPVPTWRELTLHSRSMITGRRELAFSLLCVRRAWLGGLVSASLFLWLESARGRPSSVSVLCSCLVLVAGPALPPGRTAAPWGRPGTPACGVSAVAAGALGCPAEPVEDVCHFSELCWGVCRERVLMASVSGWKQKSSSWGQRECARQGKPGAPCWQRARP